MRERWLRWVAVWSLGLVTLAGFPAGALAGAPGGAFLEGRVVGTDGRPAQGYRVHLIDDRGADLAQSTTDERGVYSFRDVDAGRYALGVESPTGGMAPVATPPIPVASGQLARRDVQLVQAQPGYADSAVASNYGLKMWWVSLPSAGKAWVIVGLVAVAGVTIAALVDDEPDASPVSP